MMKDFTPTSYTLECVATGRHFEDEGWLLEDKLCASPSLVRASYSKRHLTLYNNDFGLYKFANWLPVNNLLIGSSAPVTYHSRGLAEFLEMPNLYITFSGYNPKIGANMTTCSFKETEAYSVCGRITAEKRSKILVVASAGNTARAFAKVCSDNKIPLLLCVPEDNIDALWFDYPLDKCVKLVVTKSGSDYTDAINLSNLITSSPHFYAEGGAKNIARRDGMGCTVLSAVTTIGRIPDYYIQAVGSGTGAIAAWEANLRLIEDGTWGRNLMSLHLAQNAPFTPMYNAWRNDSRDLPHYSAEQARLDAEAIDAKVLSNRQPPYSIKGGLYDALVATKGDITAVTNEQARHAKELFQHVEGVDIHPASAVAVAALINAIADGSIARKSTVMLNITGGGEELYKKGRKMWYLSPDIVFDYNANSEEVLSQVETLFAK